MKSDHYRWADFNRPNSSNSTWTFSKLSSAHIQRPYARTPPASLSSAPQGHRLPTLPVLQTRNVAYSSLTMIKEATYAFQNSCVGREIKGRRQKSSGSYSKCRSTTPALTNPPPDRAEKQLVVPSSSGGKSIAGVETSMSISLNIHSIYG